MFLLFLSCCKFSNVDNAKSKKANIGCCLSALEYIAYIYAMPKKKLGVKISLCFNSKLTKKVSLVMVGVLKDNPYSLALYK